MAQHQGQAGYNDIPLKFIVSHCKFPLASFPKSIFFGSSEPAASKARASEFNDIKGHLFQDIIDKAKLLCLRKWRFS